MASACNKDLGNYNYHDINELQIQGISENYEVRSNIDTLRIKPFIEATMDESDPSRYEYTWIIRPELSLTNETISREKELEYPIFLDPISYELFYRVRDKETGVTWMANSKLTVRTAYSRGLLIMGEDEQGFAEAEMLSMIPDTIHMKKLLSNSGLPPLREPISLMHTGGSEVLMKIWAMTKTRSYYLSRSSMEGTTNNNFGGLLYSSEDIPPEGLHPIVVAPQIINETGTIGSSLYRAFVTLGGDVFTGAPLILGADNYNNPINRVAMDPKVRIPAAPYLLYPINRMNSLMWYDLKNNRFLNITDFLGSSSVVLADTDLTFPWNQPAGRTLLYAENTRNTDGGSIDGNSFAIMKDSDNTHHVYKFYANGTNPAKRAAYVVSAMATDFDKADFYAFSSNRSVIFYSIANKLYAYDYNPGFEKIYTFPEIGNDEITMLKFDTQIDPLTNSLYIATYNTQNKGTLRRYIVGTNPDRVEVQLQENSTWTDMIKIKDINWRAVY